MYRIELKAIRSGYDRETCWVQARGGMIPGEPGNIVLTMQKLLLAQSDVFYAINEMRSDDLGNSWHGPYEHAATLGRRQYQDGIEQVPCDFTPGWHVESGKLLGTGNTVSYKDNKHISDLPLKPSYSVYDAEIKTWDRWNIVEMPNDDIFFHCGAGSSQRVDCNDGTILLPVYTKEKLSSSYKSTVVRCTFNGKCLTYAEHGDILAQDTGRGLYEPSIICHQGHYFLTMRNDFHGYIAKGDDGLHWSKPKKWKFDNDVDLGNYNTQQHWVAGGDKLYLVYTRRCMWNNHVFRHRAPLFMAEVDLDKLTIKRNTERIIIPERGARLGNFQPLKINNNETWVIAAEWMQNDDIGFGIKGAEYCEQFGSDNTIWLAKLVFQD